MGQPIKGGERRTFIGIAEGTDEDPAKLTDALRSAAQEAIDAGLIRRAEGDEEAQTQWFEVTSIEVELANQHPKTFKVGVTVS